MKRSVVVILLTLLLVIPALGKTALKIGEVCPSFELKNTAGKTVALNQYLGKSPIILSFFSSWSKSCKKEIEFLNTLADQYEKKNIVFIGISFDRKTKDLDSFLAKNKVSFEIIHDKKLKTLKDFRILIIPTLFVIDKEGNIKSIYVDFDKNVKEAVSKEVKKLLEPPKKTK